MLKKAVVFCLFGLMLIFSAACTPQEEEAREAKIIPMEDFFRNPEKAAYKLSPNGEYLAYMAPWEGRMNVHVQKIGSDEVVRVTQATERDIPGFAWANNNRIVFIQDAGGDENWHAYAVNLDGSDYLELTPFEGVRTQIVDRLEDNDDNMLISLNKRDPRIFDVYLIDINTGEMKMVAENPGNITGWMTDNDGNLRVAITTDGINNSILYRATDNDPFKTIVTTSFKDSISPLFFTFDNKHLYVSSNIDRDKSAIFKYDVANGKHLDLVFEHDQVDVAGLLRSKARKVITGVAFTTDMTDYHFFDDTRRELQEFLEGELPGYEVAVAGMSKDESKVLVRTYSDKSRGAYYFHDRSTRELTKLVEISPWIDENEMADMKPIKYTSRDGLTIHGYLTLPRGVTASNLPVVINPHGGPWARDGWGFNSEVQMLANRGYAVLQMNFRGSTGYGKEFWQASFKEWGRKMQDDITDGVQWLIAEGIADPERVGIYGGSYGGYAVLAGMTFTPELYACGVDYVGVSNLFTFMQTIPPYWKPMLDMMYEMVGNPETDKELMEAASPILHVDKIQAPLFVAQGANDPRVNKDESDQMVEALKARGIDVPYMVKDNEGHGFANEENRFDFYRAMEEFLGEHLGGKVEQTAEVTQ